MPTLEILICTFGSDGLSRAASMTLPRLEGVSYLLSIQNPGGEPLFMPDSLRRPDVRWVVTSTSGLSNNRNEAFRVSRGDILLIADDDLHYTSDGLQAVRQHFIDRPADDFATFMHTGGDNKWFPSEPFSFDSKPPRGYYLTSFELAVRRASLRPGMCFSPMFGIGAPYFQACEEDVFLMHMLRSGLHGSFNPVVVARHPAVSTGVRRATPGVLRAQGACMRLRHGTLMGFLHLLRDVPRRPAPFFESLRYMAEGFLALRSPNII